MKIFLSFFREGPFGRQKFFYCISRWIRPFATISWNFSILTHCDRQEKRFSLLPCAKNTKLYTEFMGSEKNGNSLNEMKILVVFLEMFRQINGLFLLVPFQRIPYQKHKFCNMAAIVSQKPIIINLTNM